MCAKGKNIPMSLLLCNQKWTNLSLAMSTNMGKICEDFIENQIKILKIMFIISYC